MLFVIYDLLNASFDRPTWLLQGVDTAYDKAQESLQAADRELKTYLKAVQQDVGNKQIVYVSLQKDSHVLEIPEVFLLWAPSGH